MRLAAVLVLMISAATVAAQAQVSTTDQPHHLIIDASVKASLPQRHRAIDHSPSSLNEPPLPSDVRSVVESLTGALSRTPHMRAADAMVGTALIAFGTRRHHPMSSAVFLGVHAVQLGLARQIPLAWRAFDIQPEVSRGRVAITIRRTVGEAR
jgi:hypothetical protein